MSELLKGKNYWEVDDTICFHPGYFIENHMECLELSLEEMASRTGIDKETLTRLINADMPMTEEIASKLVDETGTSVRMWMGYQDEYERFFFKHYFK